MKGKIFRYILLLLLFADLFYSFVQHYHMCLDGDLAIVVLPSDACSRVLTDPFGFSALKGEHYFAPNRFFAHASTYAYFNSIPFVCQLFVSPVDSLYLSCAIAKIGIQIFILWLLSTYISGTWNIRKKRFLLTAVLITPMFQTWGFGRYLGIIDQSITYTFFYAFPLALVMLFFLPFYMSHIHHKPIKFKPITAILWVALSIVIAFNGPLNAPLVIVVCTLFFIYAWWNLYKASSKTYMFAKAVSAVKKIPPQVVIFFGIICMLCVYSFYIGTFNNAFSESTIPLMDRYLLLPKGLYLQFTSSFGPPLLVLMICINLVCLYPQKRIPAVKAILSRLKWIFIFSIIYILLMPLGGYRAYRPFIIRYDTFMPINICLIYFYGISTLYLLKFYSSKFRPIYGCLLVCLLGIFTVADQNGYIVNRCEKEALKTIAKSTEKVVFIEKDCPIMYWGKVSDYNQTKWNMRYLRKMNVVNEEKYYYQK